MRVVALDTHDGYREGEEYDVPEHRARKLIRKGLVKAGPVPKNKMAPPSENKADPIKAVGTGHTLSSSPAARASQRTTLKLSDSGARRRRGESSP
jgi:hypothetical protein